MDVLYVASEVAPFSKSGGLGDVSEALPRAL
ncbi:MAG TPA: glycogen/starch synthase, partial [Anaeromyxobacteraceae bacterium]